MLKVREYLSLFFNVDFVENKAKTTKFVIFRNVKHLQDCD